MALELHIAGPGLDTSLRVEPGDAPLILGRDAECSVCLPDPQKNVSRRHLSVWNEEDELHFHVLSVVNGIDMPFGEAPPGARGVLPLGQTLKIAEYSLTVAKAGGANKADAAAAPADDGDPWADLDADSATRPAPMEPESVSQDNDPFGEWGFETTFGSDMPGGGGGLQASGLKVAEDIQAFYRGLGFEPGAMSAGELEAIGRLVRTAVLGLVQLRTTMGGSRQEMKAEDRTMLAPVKERNPLVEGEMAVADVLQYVFGGRASSVGFVGPERAMIELVGDLIAHEKATSVACRAAVEGTLREFEPEALKERLLGGGAKLFESARAWEAFSRHFEEQGENFEAWAQRMLDKHFTGTYLRESMRVKRDTGSRQR